MTSFSQWLWPPDPDEVARTSAPAREYVRVPLSVTPPCAALVEPGTPPRVVALEVGRQRIERAEFPAFRRAVALIDTLPPIGPAIEAALRLEITPPAASAPQKQKRKKP